MQKSKPKHYLNYRRTLPKILVICISLPLMLGISCYGFAKFGGEFASANVLPIYPDSVYISGVYRDGFQYRIKDSIFYSEQSPEQLREWFIKNGVPLSPIPLNIEQTENIEHDGYYGTPPLFDSSHYLPSLHILSTYFFGWFSDFTRSCQGVHVYYDEGIFTEHFPNIQETSERTPYVITTCWPRVK